MSTAGQKALEYAKKKFVGYKYKLGYDPDGKTIDYSHLVHEAFKGAGYSYRYKTAAKQNWENENFKKVEDGRIQPGDVVLFKGHMGIVQSFDPKTGSGEFLGSQTKNGPSVAKFSIGDPKVYWGNPNGKAFEGFYRYRDIDRSSSSSSVSTSASQ